MGTAVVTVLSLSHKNSKTYKDKINCLIHRSGKSNIFLKTEVQKDYIRDRECLESIISILN